MYSECQAFIFIYLPFSDKGSFFIFGIEASPWFWRDFSAPDVSLCISIYGNNFCKEDLFM